MTNGLRNANQVDPVRPFICEGKTLFSHLLSAAYAFPLSEV